MGVDIQVLPDDASAIGLDRTPDALLIKLRAGAVLGSKLRARYWRMDSGMESQPSPVSIPFLAIILILARLFCFESAAVQLSNGAGILPVLEPDLNGSLGHVDFLGDALADGSSGRGVLVELHFEGDELVLGSTLTLVVLLLLGQGALAQRAAVGGFLLGKLRCADRRWRRDGLGARGSERNRRGRHSRSSNHRLHSGCAGGC